MALAVTLAGSGASDARSRKTGHSSIRSPAPGAATRATPRGKSRRGWKRPGVHRQRAGRALRRRTIRPKALSRSLRPGDTLVLDLDNTVVDTRPRTLEAARRFARSGRDLPREVVERIERATVADVGYDGAGTAVKLGIPRSQRPAFEKLWAEVFWDADSLLLDTPIDSTIELARDAARRGIRVRYLTGRPAHYRDATLRQVERLGLPLASHNELVLKPESAGDTARFKRDRVRALARRGRVVFVDDSPGNLAALGGLRGVRTFQVDFPVREPGWTQVRGAGRLDLGGDVAR